ncbi:MAG: hypothetical protein K0S08_1706 [Gammaproteobacteria bacterium]|nr:hypothetical protein [Gammaproteobacteria bacterium]
MVYPVIEYVQAMHNVVNLFINQHGRHESDCFCFFKAGENKKWVAYLQDEVSRQNNYCIACQTLGKDLAQDYPQIAMKAFKEIAVAYISRAEQKAFLEAISLWAVSNAQGDAVNDRSLLLPKKL